MKRIDRLPIKRLDKYALRLRQFCLGTLLTLITATMTIAQKPSEKDLPNFAVVAPGIYRGAAPTPEGLRRLKAMGVKTIIDLRIEKHGQKTEADAAQRLGLTRQRIPMGREAPTSKQVAAFLSTLDGAAQRPVFVHCQWGADRTGAMVGIWRVTRQHWTFDHAYREMRHYGFKPWLTDLKASVEHRAAK